MICDLYRCKALKVSDNSAPPTAGTKKALFLHMTMVIVPNVPKVVMIQRLPADEITNKLKHQQLCLALSETACQWQKQILKLETFFDSEL